MTDAINIAELDRQTFDDPAFKKEILDLFVMQAPALLAAIIASEGDMRAETAHRLKGSALAIAAGELAEASGQLEHHPDEAGHLLRVEKELAAVLAFIQTIR